MRRTTGGTRCKPSERIRECEGARLCSDEMHERAETARPACAAHRRSEHRPERPAPGRDGVPRRARASAKTNKQTNTTRVLHARRRNPRPRTPQGTAVVSRTSIARCSPHHVSQPSLYRYHTCIVLSNVSARCAERDETVPIWVRVSLAAQHIPVRHGSAPQFHATMSQQQLRGSLGDELHVPYAALARRDHTVALPAPASHLPQRRRKQGLQCVLDDAAHGARRQLHEP